MDTLTSRQSQLRHPLEAVVARGFSVIVELVVVVEARFVLGMRDSVSVLRPTGVLRLILLRVFTGFVGLASC